MYFEYVLYFMFVFYLQLETFAPDHFSSGKDKSLGVLIVQILVDFLEGRWADILVSKFKLWAKDT